MSLDVHDDFAASLNVSSNALFRRKVLKSCDPCRRRKVRCDGNEGGRCLNCKTSENHCTYKVPSNVKKRGSKAHIEDLEIRLANADKLIHLLSPGIDLPKALNELDINPPKKKGIITSIRPLADTAPRSDSILSDELLPSDEEYSDSHRDLLERENPIFWGKSSGLRLVKFAMDTRNVVTGKHATCRVKSLKVRDEYWGVQKWMVPPKDLRRVTCNFPAPDLLSQLIDLYFKNANSFLPLLHRPSFERAIAEDLHHKDIQFAMVTLLVCAIGVRFSDDPRIPPDFEEPTSPGYIWFYQAQEMRRSTLLKPSLYDLQGYCLSAVFLDGASPDHARWTMLGAGIRLAQEVGIHRKQKYGTKPSVQSELWKRAFWVLLVKDRISSASLGRTCALQEEDFDLDLPIECDDEYWETDNPEDAFKQPPGHPSYVSYFVWLIQITRILSSALRKICSIEKFNQGINLEWNKRALERLESELVAWDASLPKHLLWDPDRVDPLHYKQSALLRVHYCFTQIVAHWPLVLSRKHQFLTSSASERSVTTCLDAARECLRLADTARERLGMTLRLCIGPIFASGIIMLLNVWREKQISGTTEGLADVQKCLDALGSIEKRWHAAGRLRDIIHGLMTASDMPKRSTEAFQAAQVYRNPYRPIGPASPGSHSKAPIFEYCASHDPTAFAASPYTEDLCLSQQDMLTRPPALSASFWMDFSSSMGLSMEQSWKPQQKILPNNHQAEEYFELWSTVANGNEFEEWTSYLYDVGQMVQGLQGESAFGRSA